MAKATTRLTKAAVLDEVRKLRAKVVWLVEADTATLREAYHAAFPAEKVVLPTREFCIRSLLMSQTYDMTNALNLE